MHVIFKSAYTVTMTLLTQPIVDGLLFEASIY